MNITNADSFELYGSNSFLVVGQTNSGKSYLLHKVIQKLEKTHSPEDLKYALFDLKRCEFQREGEDYKKEYLKFGVVDDPEMTLHRLDYLSRIADTRVRMHINKPLLFIYVEECDAAFADQQRFDDALINIITKAKQANMILFYATSRPATDCVSDRLIKAFDKVLVGAMASKTDADRFSVPFEDIPQHSFRLIENKK